MRGKSWNLAGKRDGDCDSDDVEKMEKSVERLMSYAEFTRKNLRQSKVFAPAQQHPKKHCTQTTSATHQPDNAPHSLRLLGPVNGYQIGGVNDDAEAGAEGARVSGGRPPKRHLFLFCCCCCCCCCC